MQSLDGTLNVFEQDTFAFSRFLPGFLLPGPMVYVERTDSFVTMSSSYQLESYRFEKCVVHTTILQQIPIGLLLLPYRKFLQHFFNKKSSLGGHSKFVHS